MEGGFVLAILTRFSVSLQAFIAKKEEEVKKKVTNRRTMMQQRVCG
jgi:hypothetical protein